MRAAIHSAAVSALDADRYVTVARQGSARSTSCMQWARSRSDSCTWTVTDQLFFQMHSLFLIVKKLKKWPIQL